MTLLRIGVIGLGAVAQSVHLPLVGQGRWDLLTLSRWLTCRRRS